MTRDELARAVVKLPGWRLMLRMGCTGGYGPCTIIALGEGRVPRVGIAYVEDHDGRALDEIQYLPGAELVPDFDATGGCLLALLGGYVEVHGGGPSWRVCWTPDSGIHDGTVGRGTTLGEACARVALALGHWPGGGS